MNYTMIVKNFRPGQQGKINNRQQDLVELRDARGSVPTNAAFRPSNLMSRVDPRSFLPAMGANTASIDQYPIQSLPWPIQQVAINTRIQWRSFITSMTRESSSIMACAFPLCCARERFPLGWFGHNCTGPYVPENEQRYRGIASQSSRKNTRL